MQKWEYLFATPEFTGLDRLQEYLGDRGNEGWELVAMTSRELGGEHQGVYVFYTMVFKRPLPESKQTGNGRATLV